MFTESFWNERYESRDALWSGNPNPHLVAEVAGLSPGTALDVGCGEGADAIWLAQHGWRATGVDISTVALRRAAAHAGAEHVTWLRADLIGWDPAPHRYDLISAQYLHLPPEPRTALFRALAAAVTPGGTLLIVGHHPSDMLSAANRPQLPDLFFTGDDIASLLDPTEWRIARNAAPAREATGPDGSTVTIHDTVLRATRTAKR